MFWLFVYCIFSFNQSFVVLWTVLVHSSNQMSFLLQVRTVELSKWIQAVVLAILVHSSNFKSSLLRSTFLCSVFQWNSVQVSVDDWIWNTFVDFVRSKETCQLRRLAAAVFLAWGVPFEIEISYRRQASTSLKLQHLFDVWPKFIFSSVSKQQLLP